VLGQIAACTSLTLEEARNHVTRPGPNGCTYPFKQEAEARITAPPTPPKRKGTKLSAISNTKYSKSISVD